MTISQQFRLPAPLGQVKAEDFVAKLGNGGALEGGFLVPNYTRAPFWKSAPRRHRSSLLDRKWQNSRSNSNLLTALYLPDTD